MTGLAVLVSLWMSSAQAQQDPPPEAANGVLYSWSLAYGGYVGGTTGYLVGEAIEERESGHTFQGILPGALVGAAGGVTTGFLLSKGMDVSLDDAVFLWTGSGVGTFYGVQIGRALIPIDAPGAVERVHAAGLAGSMAGTGVAFLANAPGFGSQLHFDLATGIGSLAAGGVGDAADLYLPEDQQTRAGINLVGSAAFGGVAILYESFADRHPNAGAWGLSLGHGAWIGGMTPYLFTDDPGARQVLGGVRAGFGVGYAGALALASAGNPTPKSVALQSLGIASGSALGAGIPMSIGGEGPAALVVGPMLAGGVAGQVLGAAVAPHYDVSSNDVFLLGTLGAWTGYQAAGWATYAAATGQQPSQALGYALSTGGSGTLLALGLAPALEVSPSGSAMLLSAGGWGTWYGGWSAQLLNSGPENGWLLMLATGDVALLGTALAQGAGWQPTWRDVGLIDGLGLLGGAAGGLVGVVALYQEDNWNPMVASILVGSTVGLGTGIVLAARTPKGADLASGLPTVRLGRVRYLPMLAARPWMDDTGQPGVFGELSLHEIGSVAR